MTPLQHPSPNFTDRRDGLTPSMIVLHFTAMASAEAALERLCDPGAEVSAHYLIGRDGTLWQMVDEEKRAWHAGAGEWRGLQDINSRSVGIELDNDGAQPFGEPLMAVLEGLLAGLMERWRIAPEGVIAHSDMAPGRKSDPGARFDWARLARQGLSIWPAGSEISDEKACEAISFRQLAHAIGYRLETDDATLLTAFRLRFRPWRNGPLDTEDIRIARDIARRFGVDAGTPTA